jgi:16S rRNA (uracil1498-N3)-methyltransferase
VAAGARPVGLGPLRLRVETAAVAIMSCVSMTHPRTQPPGC